MEFFGCLRLPSKLKFYLHLSDFELEHFSKTMKAIKSEAQSEELKWLKIG